MPKDPVKTTDPKENRTPYLIIGGAAAAYAAWTILGLISGALSLALVVPAAYYGLQLYNNETEPYQNARKHFANGNIPMGLWESFPVAMQEIYSKLGGPSKHMVSKTFSGISQQSSMMFSNMVQSMVGSRGGPKSPK